MILILDFGSQVTQLIARRFRELGHYSEIHPFNLSVDKVQALKPSGIVLSGGPQSVYDRDAPQRDLSELIKIAPLFGICYGMQLIAHQFGGRVEAGKVKEYGKAKVRWSGEFSSWGLQSVWMSHGDSVTQVASGAEIVGESENHISAFSGKNLLAVQFHPEVTHTENGERILKYFVEEMCGAKANWTGLDFLPYAQSIINKNVKAGEKVLCALSGGVDSTVLALLLNKTLGPERVHCFFINNGLLRQGEFESVLNSYKEMGLRVLGVDAETEFLSALQGITDPESKRKAIGRVFIEVFDKTIKTSPEFSEITWLAQGTLYPDVIESVSHGGTLTIKSHHNVGGLPPGMRLKVLEPFREFFKDEVRSLGQTLGLKDEIRLRHPFPGPGLGIRVIGEVTKEKLNILREADAVFIEQLRAQDLYKKIWQAFVVLLPVRTVGVQGDGRSYDFVVSLRAVTSSDGMTADWFDFDSTFLRLVSNEITNRVRGVSRVVYDITSKPPATIEWE